MKTAKELWVHFSDRTLPRPCSDLQYRETRLAFYAGIYSLLSELTQIPDSQSDDESMLQLQGLSDEVEQFHREELARRTAP